MAGYSYFNYDQMTIFEVEVHSEQLELLKDAADEYDWEAIKTEIEPLFKDAALDFRNRKRSSACPRKDASEAFLQETFPFWDEIEEPKVSFSSRKRKLEHMRMEVPTQCECEKKQECSPNSEIGRIYRVKREVLSQIDWDNPKFSYRFKLVYSLRTKIERLFSRMKERFKMKHIYKRGIDKIRGHVLKFMNLMHILANLQGTYGV